MQSLIDSNRKVKEGNSQQLDHHGLIRILIKDALQNLNIPIKWLVFKHLPIEDDIETLIYDVIPFVSEQEAKQEEKGIELHGDKMDEEETNTEDDAETKEEEGIEIEGK